MIPLPRQLNNIDPRSVLAAVREIVAFLLSLPRYEIKTVETATATEIVLTTGLRVKGVLLVQAYQVANPDTTVTFSALPDWRLVREGVKVRINTGSVLHSFTFLLVGA